jgi:biotin carboxyl carrier protein
MRITVGGRSYDVEVTSPHESPLTVVVDGETFQVVVESGEAEALPRATAKGVARPSPRPAAQAGSPQITAPMPGKILDIAVQAGDRVELGQTLCALEAMKMKSPIRAQRAGTVVQVHVHDSQTVEYGDLLFVIE